MCSGAFEMLLEVGCLKAFAVVLGVLSAAPSALPDEAQARRTLRRLLVDARRAAPSEAGHASYPRLPAHVTVSTP